LQVLWLAAAVFSPSLGLLRLVAAQRGGLLRFAFVRLALPALGSLPHLICLRAARSVLYVYVLDNGCCVYCGLRGSFI
jgi:hypothetical protein